MGRTPCCSKEGLNKGAWTVQEDQILADYIKTNGEGKWRNIPKKSGLKRCGKSCRLRWLNYLRPDIVRGNITLEEEDLIIRLHNLLGNRWSLIAGRLPGRTDNEIKNYWNTTLGKKAKGEEPKNSKQGKKKTKIKLSVNSSTSTEEEGGNLAPKHDKVENLETSVAPETSIDEDLANNVAITTYEEENSENFAMDFNVGDLLLSDLPDSDFWKLCQFDNVMEEGGNSGGAKNKWLSSGQPRLFSEEMMKDWMRDDCFHYKN